MIKLSGEKSRGESVFIPPAPVVFPIALAEEILLKTAYCDEPTVELSKIERINNFLKPLENHHFQKLLVTPLKKGEGTILQAAYCFNIKAKEAELRWMSEQVLQRFTTLEILSASNSQPETKFLFQVQPRLSTSYKILFYSKMLSISSF